MSKIKVKQGGWSGFVVPSMTFESQHSNIDYSNLKLRRGARDPWWLTCWGIAIRSTWARIQRKIGVPTTIYKWTCCRSLLWKTFLKRIVENHYTLRFCVKFMMKRMGKIIVEELIVFSKPARKHYVLKAKEV